MISIPMKRRRLIRTSIAGNVVYNLLKIMFSNSLAANANGESG